MISSLQMSEKNGDDSLLHLFAENGSERSPSPSGLANPTNPPSIGAQSPTNDDNLNSTDDSSGTASSVENLLKFAPQFASLPGFGLRSPFPLNNLMSNLFAANFPNNRESALFGAFANSADSSDNAHRLLAPEDLSLREKTRNENEETTANGSTNWSFEEQFKQLYELSDDTKRKEWLDDWFQFKQERGTPVTRIPIMAKQVLDLYELYRLVVQHGGLVEVINKKLWREITKGLNLPSSITSAAFTLRTQYHRYLYDYECARENLSTEADLQAAIEGNKREGRRNNPSMGTANSSAPNGSNHFPYAMVPNSAAVAMASSFFKNPFGFRTNETSENSRNEGSEAQRNLELFQRMADVMSQQGTSGRDSASSADSSDMPTAAKRIRQSSSVTSNRPPIPESPKFGSLDQILKGATTTNMKLTSGNGRNGEKSMVVSMEMNGIMYQGVLFAVNSLGAQPTATATVADLDPLGELFGAASDS